MGSDRDGSVFYTSHEPADPGRCRFRQDDRGDPRDVYVCDEPSPGGVYGTHGSPGKTAF